MFGPGSRSATISQSVSQQSVRRLLALFTALLFLSGCGPKSEPAPSAAPTPPEAVSVTSYPGYNRVEWQHAGGPGLSAFRVYRSLAGESLTAAQAGTRLGDVGADVRHLDDRTARPGSTYNYSVSALGDGGEESLPVADPEPPVATLPAPGLQIVVAEGGVIDLPVRRSTMLPVTVQPLAGYTGTLSLQVRPTKEPDSAPIFVQRLDDAGEELEVSGPEALELLFGAWVFPLEAEPGEQHGYELVLEDETGNSWQVPLDFLVTEGPELELAAVPDQVQLSAADTVTIQVDYPEPPDDATVIFLTAHPLDAYRLIQLGDEFDELFHIPADRGPGSVSFDLQPSADLPLGEYTFNLILGFGETGDAASLEQFIPLQWDWVEVLLDIQPEPAQEPHFRLITDQTVTEARSGVITHLEFTLLPVAGFSGLVSFDIRSDSKTAEYDLVPGNWTAELDGVTPQEFTLELYPFLEQPGETVELELIAFSSTDDELTVSQQWTLDVVQGPDIGLTISDSEFILQIGGDAVPGTLEYDNVPPGAVSQAFGGWIISSDHAIANFDWNAPYDPEPVPAQALMEFSVQALYGVAPPGEYALRLAVAFLDAAGKVLQWGSVPVQIEVEPSTQPLNAEFATLPQAAAIGEEFTAHVVLDLPEGFVGDLEFKWIIGKYDGIYEFDEERLTIESGGTDTEVELTDTLWQSMEPGLYTDSQLWISLVDDPDAFSVLFAEIEILP